eukprot:SAG22_NODE_7514_length_732_cov_1.462875_1_plen_82_part_01
MVPAMRQQCGSRRLAAVQRHLTAAASAAPAGIDPLPLSGQIALVTGGGRGIGRAISAVLAARGAKVAVVYRSDAAAAEEAAA